MAFTPFDYSDISLGNDLVAQALANRALRAAIVKRYNVPLEVAGTNPYVQPLAATITLPDNAKIQFGPSLLAAGAYYPRGGTTTPFGILSVAAGPVVNPATKTVNATPTGDLIFNAADAWTGMDITYIPAVQDVVNATYSVTPGTGVVNGLPSGLLMVMEAEILAAGIPTTKCFVQVPVGLSGSVALTTKQVALAQGGAGVTCCISDAVTSIRLKLGVVPA